MDYLLTDEQLETIYRNKYGCDYLSKKPLMLAVAKAQLAKVQQMVADMESWYDQALDWRELEVERAQKRVTEIEEEYEMRIKELKIRQKLV